MLQISDIPILSAAEHDGFFSYNLSQLKEKWEKLATESVKCDSISGLKRHFRMKLWKAILTSRILFTAVCCSFINCRINQRTCRATNLVSFPVNKLVLICMQIPYFVVLIQKSTIKMHTNYYLEPYFIMMFRDYLTSLKIHN